MATATKLNLPDAEPAVVRLARQVPTVRQRAIARNHTIVARAAELLDPDRPMTLRHLFYLLVSEGLISNSDTDYQNLIRIMVAARWDERIDFGCLVDGLRDSIKPSSWSGLADFADTVRDAYRKDLWQKQPHYVEFIFEKDAILGVVEDIGRKYDVRLRPLRGQSSVTFLYDAAKEIAAISKPAYIYYLGDHDPAGYAIEESAHQRLAALIIQLNYGQHCRKLWAEEKCVLKLLEQRGSLPHWQRLGFGPEDFERFGISPLHAKRTDTNYKKFIERFGTDDAAELDAIPPDALRKRVEDTVLSHIDSRAWGKLQKIEKLERESFNQAMKVFGKK